MDEGFPSEYPRFSVHDEVCRVMDVANLWHKDGIPEFDMNKINTSVTIVHVSNWLCDVLMQVLNTVIELKIISTLVKV